MEGEKQRKLGLYGIKISAFRNTGLIPLQQTRAGCEMIFFTEAQTGGTGFAL